MFDFKDYLVFEKHEEPREFKDYDGVVRTIGDEQYIYHFPNGFGASIIRSFMSCGHKDGLWELAVLYHSCEDKWHLCYDTRITNDVLGYRSVEDINELLKEIKELEPNHHFNWDIFYDPIAGVFFRTDDIEIDNAISDINERLKSRNICYITFADLIGIPKQDIFFAIGWSKGTKLDYTTEVGETAQILTIFPAPSMI